MFLERMEVLEYRQNFEVEQSTFPDTTNSETPRKLDFSLTCVCLSVRLSVCAKKFVSGYLTKELTDLNENYGSGGLGGGGKGGGRPPKNRMN